MSLFNEDAHDFRISLVDAYTQTLLDNPPVRTLRPEEEPDESKRRRNARAIALKDVRRVLLAARNAGLSGEQIQAVADLYESEKR